jgi:hypothetical protein
MAGGANRRLIFEQFQKALRFIARSQNKIWHLGTSRIAFRCRRGQ